MVVQNKMSALGKPVLLYEDARDLTCGPGWKHHGCMELRIQPPKRSEDEVSEGGDEGLQYIYIRIGMAPWSMLLNSH